jgi:hypothetical protein
MYLVDTNIWLERLLEQDRADEVRRFLSALPSDQLALSHFSLHSIGVILGRYGRYAALEQFIHDLFIVGMVQLVTIPPTLFGQITATMTTHRLDFDDAYQYVALHQINGELVSFDTDFDRSDVQRLTPAMVVARLAPPEPPPV